MNAETKTETKQEAKGPAKRSIIVVVPQRSEFNGAWAIGQHFLPGQHPLEVTEAQYAELKHDEHHGKIVSVLENPTPQQVQQAKVEEEKELAAASKKGRHKSTMKVNPKDDEDEERELSKSARR